MSETTPAIGPSTTPAGPARRSGAAATILVAAGAAAILTWGGLAHSRRVLPWTVALAGVGLVCFILAVILLWRAHHVTAGAADLTGGAARESEPWLQQVMANLQVVVWLVTARKDQVLYVSPAYETMWGCSRDRLLAAPLSWTEAIHPADRPAVVAAVMQEHPDPAPLVFRIIRPDGALRWIRVRAYPILDQEGDVVWVAGVAEDLTEQMQAGETSRQSEQSFRALIENSPDPVLVFREARVGYANDAAARFLGYERREDLHGRPVARCFPADEVGIVADIEQVMQKAATRSAREVRVSRRDDSTAPSQSVWFGMTFEGAPAVVVMSRDLTEHNRLEEQLRQSQKMDAVGQLAGGVAHDFNNMLAVILANAGFLLGELGEADPRRDGAQEILAAAQRAASLTRQLLAFSRKHAVAPEVLDIGSVVGDMKKMLGRLISEDIELETSFDHALAPVRVDRGQLEQVILNLVVNGRDAMATGGKLRLETANVRVEDEHPEEVDGLPAGDYAVLTVSDTGGGIDPAIRARIFEPFFTTKEQGKGTGLGLATVYAIVCRAGGTVAVSSEPGRGATFKVYFPRATPAGGPSDAAAYADNGKLTRGSETVLLVEDEDLVRSAARRILHASGYTVLEARNGQEALALLAERQAGVDLVLTDVVMPALSGPDMATRLREWRPEIKVLFMSGFADHPLLRNRLTTATARVMRKPFTPEELTAQVREALHPARPVAAAAPTAA